MSQSQTTTNVCEKCNIEEIMFPKIKLCKKCYYKAYFEKNKVKLLARYFERRNEFNEERRARYKKDKNYRAEMKEKALSYYHYKKGEARK